MPASEGMQLAAPMRLERPNPTARSRNLRKENRWPELRSFSALLGHVRQEWKEGRSSFALSPVVRIPTHGESARPCAPRRAGLRSFFRPSLQGVFPISPGLQPLLLSVQEFQNAIQPEELASANSDGLKAQSPVPLD